MPIYGPVHLARAVTILARIDTLNSAAKLTRPRAVDVTISGDPNELLSLPHKNFSLIDTLFPVSPVKIAENSVIRSLCHAQGTTHLTSHVLLFDGNMDLYMQMRDPARSHSGGKLSQSVGGHVNFIGSRDPLTAAMVEAREEAGVDVSGSIQEIARYSYSSMSADGSNNEYVSLFLARVLGKVDPGRDEVYWLEPFGLNDIYLMLELLPEIFANSFKEDMKWLMMAWENRGRSKSSILKAIQDLSAI